MSKNQNKLNETITNSYRSAGRRLLLLDYDGTLVPFSSQPNYPEADKHAKEQLTKLCRDPKNEVYIISGRERHSLSDRFGHLEMTIIAEHGYWIRTPHSDWQVTSPDFNIGNWKPVFISIIEAYSSKCPGSFLEEKESALVWHYRKAESDLANCCLEEMRAEVGLQLQQHPDLIWLDGNKVIEVKLANCHKGVYVEKLLQSTKYDFILAMGDDRTDEDMFKALPASGYSIKVGEGQTSARLRFDQQHDVTQLLDALVEISLLENVS